MRYPIYCKEKNNQQVQDDETKTNKTVVLH